MEENINENINENLYLEPEEKINFIEISKTKLIAGIIAISMASGCMASLLTKNIIDNELDDPLLIALSEYIEYKNKNQTSKSITQEDLIDFYNSFNEYLNQGNNGKSR